MDGHHSKKRPLEDNGERGKLLRLVAYDSSDEDEELQMGGAVLTRSTARQHALPVVDQDLPTEVQSQPLDLSTHNTSAPTPEPSIFTQPFSDELTTTLTEAAPLDNQENEQNGDDVVQGISDAVPGPSGLSGPPEVLDTESDESDYEEESNDDQPSDEEGTNGKKKQRRAFLFEYDQTPPKIFKKHSAKSFKAKPIREGRDYQREMIHFQRQLVAFLKKERARRYPRGMKVHVSAKVRYHVIKNGELVDTPEFIFTSKSKTILRSDDIQTEMAPSLSHLEEQIADQQVGMSWMLSPKLCIG